MASFTIRNSFLLLFAIVNTLVAISVMYSLIKIDKFKQYFLFLTMENFMWCTAYLYIVAIYEITGKIESKFYLFVIRRVSKYLFSSCWTVVFSYWIYTLMGEDIMQLPTNWILWLLTIYLHFIIGLYMAYEIITNKERHYVKGVFYHDLLILILINIAYSVILITLSQLVDGLKIYTFLNKDLMSIIGYMVSSYMNFIVSYLMYYAIARRYNKGFISTTDEIVASNEWIEDALNSQNEKTIL